MDEQKISIDIFQKLNLFKTSQPVFDKELESSKPKRNHVSLGVDKYSEQEEKELHLLKAVQQNEKIPTKKTIQYNEYETVGYMPNQDYYVHQIDNHQQNIFYDLTEEDFIFCEKNESISLDQLEFTLTALDLMFPFKYRSLNFQNPLTLTEIYEALRSIHSDQFTYNIRSDAQFPEFHSFMLMYQRFVERRKQLQNQPLISSLREKVQKNKQIFFQPYSDDIKKPQKTSQTVKIQTLLYNIFAEFATARELLNMQFYVKNYKSFIEKFGISQFDNIVDQPDLPMPFRPVSRAQQISETIDKIKHQKNPYEPGEGRSEFVQRRQGSQFSNFVAQCLEDDEVSD
ncbi:hypothetical protein SS50377_25673 [Spironucleus salmonicida]|uniref:Uncharacterized protein n=1 Tax=Spironucleus salmonicida TaxID=348837 RepID=V6LG97_9EUKA|nr:hypothetical protein SS50377_25673 [Spironucleus salmonicida]|eukprot:EST42691.1 hypothetical protein SS50377_17712 [Spironucleus salmonicida]